MINESARSMCRAPPIVYDNRKPSSQIAIKITAMPRIENTIKSPLFKCERAQAGRTEWSLPERTGKLHRLRCSRRRLFHQNFDRMFLISDFVFPSFFCNLPNNSSSLPSEKSRSSSVRSAYFCFSFPATSFHAPLTPSLFISSSEIQLCISTMRKISISIARGVAKGCRFGF